MAVRDESPSQRRPSVGFRFATIAALVRHGYAPAKAEALMRTWERYARYAMLSGKTPENTARHLVRFEQFQSPWERDPARIEGQVDREIAADLRRHADIVGRENPEHALAIYEAADRISHISAKHRNSVPQMAAEALHTPPKAEEPQQRRRSTSTRGRSTRGLSTRGRA